MAERSCSECDNPVDPPDAKFCRHCGARLPDTDSASESEDALAPEHPAGPEQTGPEPPPPPPPSEEARLVREPDEQAAAGPPEPRGVRPDDVEPHGPHHEPEIAAESPLEGAAVDLQRHPPPASDTLRRCPACHEALYEAERVCWSCGRQVEPAVERSEPAAPGGPPEPGGPTTAAYAAAQAEAPQDVMTTAWWSFGLGLLSVFTCGVLGVLGIVAIWLGVGANRRGGGSVAVAGIVFGAAGLLMGIAWLVFLAVMLASRTGGSPSHVLMPLLNGWIYA